MEDESKKGSVSHGELRLITPEERDRTLAAVDKALRAVGFKTDCKHESTRRRESVPDPMDDGTVVIDICNACHTIVRELRPFTVTIEDTGEMLVVIYQRHGAPNVTGTGIEYERRADVLAKLEELLGLPAIGRPSDGPRGVRGLPT